MTEKRSENSVIEVKNLDVIYSTDKGPLHTVRNVSLQIAQGEVYGLVGESGSGKTTLARAVIRYLPQNGSIAGGPVLLNGLNLLDLSKQEMRKIWGSKITMVHQNPAASVNPAIPVGEQIAEVARAHMNMNRSDAWNKAIEMLDQVRMSDPERVARRYAHQLSGGQLQRILIATALTTNPQFLIMDEPTTALDVTTEAIILDMLRELLKAYQTAVLYITHNLGVVARICDRVGVMYAGELMEEGTVGQVFKKELHPYTLGLLGCVPRVDRNKSDIELSSIPGFIPRPDQLPDGCIFAPRCLMAEDACRHERPPLIQAELNHLTACRRWQEVAVNPGAFVALEKGAIKEDMLERPLVLDARHIKKHFKLSGVGLDSLFRRGSSTVRAVDDISVRILAGNTMGIVGESGCGKTTFARCIAGLEEATDGEIELQGTLLPYTISKRQHELLKEIQVVFQNPDASLNPQYPVGKSVGRPLAVLGGVSGQEIEKRVKELFAAVNLPDDYVYRLPHELSGGEKQRVAIARAFAANPALMICDEPISSLDVSVQASLMNLLVKLQQQEGTSYLFISHDLAAVRHLSDWIAVVYLGRLWEIGSAEDVFAPPCHPYTEALLSAIPIPDPDIRRERIRLHGTVPSAIDIPPGCRFHTRCPRKIGSICETEEPSWQDAGYGHEICCHIPIAELVNMQSSIQVQN